MILKLQRPLAGNAPGGPVLAYDRQRRYRWLLAMTPNAIDALLGDEPKGYFEALVGPDGYPVIGRRVDDQPW